MNNDFENYIGQNEVVTNSSINRALQKIFNLQKYLIGTSEDELTPEARNLPLIVNIVAHACRHTCVHVSLRH